MMSVLKINIVGKITVCPDDTERRIYLKVVFTDLDGTLLDDRKQVSPGNRAAIRRALEKGHKIVITTGRPLPSALLLARALDLDRPGCYLIASNGGLIYNNEQRSILYETGLSRAHVRYLLDEAKHAGIHCHSYSKTNVLCESRTKELAYYEQAISVPAIVVPDITAYLSYDPWKVILIDRESKTRLLDFQAAHTDWEKGKCSSIFSCDFMLEYCPFTATKGNGVAYLCKTLGIRHADAIAIGDAENDISMITEAGVGAAMANASLPTKAAANYITEKDNNHDGFAEVLERFVLSE